ncbi:sigma-54-dependent transcriptional regulator [Aliiroseovarius sp. PTFE2010]|uniref:sigma-54-dependent transcriptional regulator n=1 Tax=Aliiroseovarius sp. PTFE2010 TaxID=3417190 RepID=UPI003CF10392
MTPSPILLIEDTTSLRTIYEGALRQSGYQVETAASGAEARQKMRVHDYQVVLLDIMLPDVDGIELLPEIAEAHPNARIVVITAHGSVHRAVEAMRSGAFDFLTKPIDNQTLLDIVMNARADARQAERLSTEPLGGLIGSSQAMRDIYKRVRNVAKSMACVFITGETGTGKQMCAQAIHALSPQSEGPFVPVNCAAMSTEALERELTGLSGPTNTPRAFERAKGGTLFLNEVSELAPHLQAGLLTLLQSPTESGTAASMRVRSARVICACSKDPTKEMREGRLRSDLYYRLGILPIHLPPLRERSQDVIEVAEALLARIAAGEGRQVPRLSQDVRALFLEHAWPGNLRQLESVLWNQVALNYSPVIRLSSLPDEFLDARDTVSPPPSISKEDAIDALVGKTLSDVERQLIEKTIEAEGGAVSLAAKRLGVSPSTLYRKLEAWGLPTPRR